MGMKVLRRGVTGSDLCFQKGYFGRSVENGLAGGEGHGRAEPGEKETLAAGRPVISILLQIAQARENGFKRHHREQNQ